MIKELTNITTNGTVIINNIATPYISDDGELFDVYIGISATTLCSVRLSIDDNNYDTYGTCDLKRLTRQGNMYALHLSLSGYTYSGSEPEYRVVNIAMSAYTCGDSSGVTGVRISQRGCNASAKYTATVSSTTNCTISIGGVQDGSEQFDNNETVTGITTSVVSPSSKALVGYWVEPDNGTAYRVNLNSPITIQSDDITISPICSNISQTVQYNIVGYYYGNEYNNLGIIDVSTQEITGYIRDIMAKDRNSLSYEWGNIPSYGHDEYYNYVNLSIPRSVMGPYRSEGNGYGTITRGTEVYFALGLSEDETRYEPYGFEITEIIDERDRRTRILMPLGYTNINPSYPTKMTSVAIYAKMTLQYDTTIRSLVKTKTNGFVRFDMMGHGTQIITQVVAYGNTATMPTDPTESGYVFGGWYTDTACTVAYNFSSAVNSNLTLYAKWEQAAVNHTVTFNVQGHGTAPAQQTVADGGTATLPTAPTAEGYTFCGWYTEAACTNAYDFTQAVVSDIILYAKWEAVVVYYTVTFDVCGHGTAPSSQSVKAGTRATRPTNPEEYGYMFIGWYTSTAYTSTYNFLSAVNSNLTLYAKWEQVLEVIYNTKGTVLDSENPVHDKSSPLYDPTIPIFDITYDYIPVGAMATEPEIIYPGHTVVWYIDDLLQKPWNFNNKVYSDLMLYAGVEQLPDDRFRVINTSTGFSTVELGKVWEEFEYVEYSIDDGENWDNLKEGSTITLKPSGTTGDTMLIRGKILNGAENPKEVPVSGLTNFHFTGEVGLAGNINYLWDHTDLRRPLYEHCGHGLFRGNPSLKTASGLTIPNAEAAYCYCMAFFETQLEEPPVLGEVTSLGEFCYVSMFEACIYLTKSPILMAEDGKLGCYNRMFLQCKSLAEITCNLDTPDKTLTDNWVNDVDGGGVMMVNPKAGCDAWNNLGKFDGMPANFTCKTMDK